MNFRELGFWLLFLVVCFTAGYVKGFFPSDTWPSLWGGPAEIEILLQHENLLPPDIKDELEKRLKVQIKTTIVKDREEFTIRTIMSPGYHIGIVPHHWIAPAANANQMSNLNPVQDFVSQKIGSDFLEHGQERIYAVPLYWISTHLVKNSNDKIKMWHFIQDWDFIFNKMTLLKLEQKTIKPWSFWTQPLNMKAPPAAVFEVSHVAEQTILNPVLPYEKDLRSLYLWSLCTPRHSPSRKLTLKLAEAYLDLELQARIVEKLPIATTLLELNESRLPRYKKASYIREIDLSQLKQPEWLGLEQVSVLKSDFTVQ